MSDQSHDKNKFRPFRPEVAPFALDARGNVMKIMQTRRSEVFLQQELERIATFEGQQTETFLGVRKHLVASSKSLHGDTDKVTYDRMSQAYYIGGLVAVAAFIESDIKGAPKQVMVLDTLPKTDLPTKQQEGEVAYAQTHSESQLITPYIMMFDNLGRIMELANISITRSIHPDFGPIGAAATHITTSQIYQAWNEVGNQEMQTIYNFLENPES